MRYDFSNIFYGLFTDVIIFLAIILLPLELLILYCFFSLILQFILLVQKVILKTQIVTINDFTVEKTQEEQIQIGNKKSKNIFLRNTYQISYNFRNQTYINTISDIEYNRLMVSKRFNFCYKKGTRIIPIEVKI